MIESLVNTVVKEKIPAGLRYFNLVDSSSFRQISSLYFDPLDLNDFLKANPGFNPQAITTSVKESAPVNWTHYAISNARIYPNKQIPYRGLNEFVQVITLLDAQTPDSVLEKSRNNAAGRIVIRKTAGWDEEKQKAAVRQERERLRNTIPPEDQDYYSISAPLFSKDLQYAVIELAASRKGHRYIYKRINGTWVFQATMGTIFID